MTDAYEKQKIHVQYQIDILHLHQQNTFSQARLVGY